VNRKYLLILTITFLLVDIAFFLFFLTIIDEELPTEVSPPEIVKKKQFENVTLTSDLDLSCSNFCFGQGASLYKTSIYELERVTECACVDEFNQTITLKHYRFDEMTAVEPVPRIRWHNMPLTFNIERKICGDYETRKIRRGIQDVEHQTNNAVTFIETNSSEQAQILFKCEYLVDCYKKSIDIQADKGIIYETESICDHTSGIAEITEMRGAFIERAEITMVGLAGFAESGQKGASGFYIGSCGHPTIEIHELLHVLGYEHVDELESIMYYKDEQVSYTLYTEGSCLGSNKLIDRQIVDDLIATYGD